MFSRLVWAASWRVERAGAVVQVQASDAAVDAVRHRVGATLPPDDHRPATITVSLRIEARARSGPQPLHLLYVDGCLHARGREEDAVMAAMDAVLDPSATTTADHVALDAFAVVGERGAALLPTTIRPHVAVLDRRLRALGVRILDDRWTRIDTASGDVLTGAGRSPVRAWMLERVPTVNEPVRQPGLELVRDPSALPSWRVRAVLTRVEVGAALLAVWDPWPDDLAAAVAALVS